MIDASEIYEFEMHRIETGTEKQPNLWSRFKLPVAGITNGKTLEEYIFTDNLNLLNPNFRRIDDFKKSLEILADLPTAELERLMTETLDTCAYRLDAWITSLAAKRLEDLRKNNPNRNYIGAYGWVENIRPVYPHESGAEKIIIRQDGGREVSAYMINKGDYVYAPSMQQANAAAVLRNAWLVRGKDNDKQPFAVNLSSARVRKAHYLIDMIRQGQPIGAGLGYLFERYLHEKQGVELDKFIDDFRAKFPVVAGKLSKIDGAVEMVAARNVVDGFAMWEKLRKILQNITDENQKKDKIKAFLNNEVKIQPTDAEKTALVDALVDALIDLETNVDALTDLLMAESVFRLVSSDYEAGSSILDAMSRGAALPEPLVTKTPRRSYSFSQRVAVLMNANNDYWNTGGNLRSRAEPSINAWMGAMLPRPDKIECQVVFDDNERVSVRVSDLEVEPIDLLYMSINAKSNLEGGELYQRIVQFAHENKAGGLASILFIHYDIPNSMLAEEGTINLATALKVCLAAYDTLSVSRPIRPEDLWFADEENKVKKVDTIFLHQTHELNSRAIELDSGITHIKNDLDIQVRLYKANPDSMSIEEVKESLKSASHLGISTVYPYITDDKEILVQNAERTIAKIEQSLENMESQKDSDGKIKIKMAFGKQFVVIPVFRPYRVEELQNALNKEPDFGEDRDEALSKWFARVVRVSHKLGRWRKLVLYNKSLNTNQNMVEKVIQLPVINARWVGAEFGNPRNGPTFGNLNGQPQFGRLAIHVFLQDQNILNQGEPFGGLLLDFWEESIPNCAENPGVVFNYDSPGAEAPEAVLIAVPPQPVANWNHNIIIDSLNQTLDNAKIRAFDGEHEADVESSGDTLLVSEGKIMTHAYYDWEDNFTFLPMICLADNKGADPQDDGCDTVSTDFDDCIFKKP
ncbi:MAG: hypothetical protein BROFUL_01528 [Candidatus Brocadia fulgida]|uniref:Uncharacterized protein n=1 Tax=Candidatus Brocadia fulgida TaxID=380242 RepID=A0A0M2UVA7_9BACT|nr:MAG: hypothetical protein BROFUL_01528 [Candidatus Brocadia fulgida]